MVCCIINPKKLGCFSVCDSVNFGVVATIPGVYTAYFFGFNFTVKKQKTFAAGEHIIFPLEKLNEVAVYKISIESPTGVAVNPVPNDGFSIYIQLLKNI